METRKLRLDFVAHTSLVVEVEDNEKAEATAIKIAEKELRSNGFFPEWELEDGGIEDLEPDDDEVPVNYLEFDDED